MLFQPLMKQNKKCVVVSAVNLVEGGTLTVLRDCIASAEAMLGTEWRLVALVNRPGLVETNRTEILCFPAAKKSWLARLYYEWIHFNGLSRQLKPDLWLSLHDITPRVHAVQQVVYCHNPSPFYKVSWREARLDFSFLLFNKLYKNLYGAFISRNAAVIVQQNWLRDAFITMYGRLPIIVAHPRTHASGEIALAEPERKIHASKIFLFPSLPRVHKNFETLCDATRILETWGIRGFRVQITLAGAENRYARDIYARYADVKSIEYIGLQTRQQINERYRAADVIVFPGKLETWGLPISEAKSYGKDLLLADRPYARETVGTYDRVGFFEATDALALAHLMRAIVESTWKPEGHIAELPKAPFAANWDELWTMLIAGLPQNTIRGPI
jgi:glycosyltransferase involved in cell wall biosynthesis